MINRMLQPIAFKGELKTVGSSNTGLDIDCIRTTGEMSLNSELNAIAKTQKLLASTFHPEDIIEINYDKSHVKYIPGQKSLTAGLTEQTTEFRRLSYINKTSSDLINRAEEITKSICEFMTNNTKKLTDNAVQDTFLKTASKKL